MISTVSYLNTLNIKPIKTYPEGSNRETTITSFDKVLSGQKDQVSKKALLKSRKRQKQIQILRVQK